MVNSLLTFPKQVVPCKPSSIKGLLYHFAWLEFWMNKDPQLSFIYKSIVTMSFVGSALTCSLTKVWKINIYRQMKMNFIYIKSVMEGKFTLYISTKSIIRNYHDIPYYIYNIEYYVHFFFNTTYYANFHIEMHRLCLNKNVGWNEATQILR